MSTDVRAEIVIFDGFDELDVFAPFEVLSTGGLDVALVTATEAGTVISQRGLRIQAQGRLAGAERAPEVIVVPGGGWLNRAPTGTWAEVQRGFLPDRLRELAPDVPWLTSVCTGALVLAAAGLLADRTATTNPAARAELAPMVAEVRAERVVVDGPMITAGAPACGLDLGLAILTAVDGPELATQVAEGMEAETLMGTVPRWMSDLTAR